MIKVLPPRKGLFWTRPLKYAIVYLRGMPNVGNFLIMAFLIAGCAPPHDPRAGAIASMKGYPAGGQVLFRDNCESCHKPSSNEHLAQAVDGYGVVSTASIILDGALGMKAFPQFSDTQVADIYAYLKTIKK